MSKMQMDDIIFGRSLREPGYRVDFAIGTTYSLDLETFISLPFSLGFLEEPDEVMKKSQTYVFAALRLCSDRLAVFCNFSDIKVPPKSYKIYCALMEGSVFPVNISRETQIVNFHPKVWVIKQTSLEKKESILRVIVMSRNLTRDGSLDCACVLKGRIEKKRASAAVRAKHKPLVDFLKYLGTYASDSKRSQIKAIASDILYINRFDVDGPYEDYEFLPMGIPDHSGNVTLKDLSRSADLVIVSPFLDDYTVKQFASVREGKLLVTQERSISQTAVEVFGKDNIYTMNPDMTDNEEEESVDLHAKMYFSTRYDGGWKNYLYLGSTNATSNGFSSNVEFLLGLRFKRYKMSWEGFSGYFNPEQDKRFMSMVDVFKEASPQAEEYQLSLKLRRAITLITHGEVMGDNDVFSIRMMVTGEETETEIWPLMRPDLKAAVAPGLVFSDLSLIELSEFYGISSKGLNRVIKIPTEVIPKERDEEICRKAIPTEDQFMDCISFLLSESKTAYVLAHKSDSLRSKGGKTETSFPAVYEDLLREAYDSPDTFNDIKSFVESLPSNVIPHEFDNLYKTILKAIDGFRK